MGRSFGGIIFKQRKSGIIWEDRKCRQVRHVFYFKPRGVIALAVKFEGQDGQEYEIENMTYYDEIEVHEGCTVEVLRNSETGEVSIGWWYGTIKDKPVIDPMGLPC
jgi:hypothetical protein